MGGVKNLTTPKDATHYAGRNEVLEECSESGAQVFELSEGRMGFGGMG